MTFVTVGELFRGAVHARWGARRVETLTSWLTGMASPDAGADGTSVLPTPLAPRD